MANSYHVQAADAIVAELNHASRSWYRAFTAERSWKPWYVLSQEIEELQVKPKVAVVPTTTGVKWKSRNHHEWDFGIPIDVQRMFDLSLPTAKADIDALDKICQDVQDFFNDGHTLVAGVGSISNMIAFEAVRDDVFNLPLLHAEQNWETLIVVGVKLTR